MPSSVIIVTNCTNRKRADGKMVSLAKQELKGPLESVARRWAKALKKATPVDEAQNVYIGRSIVEAKNAAKAAGASLYVVSAGLGLVHESDPIPGYDLTISPGPSSIAPYLSSIQKTPADWWNVLTSELGAERSIRSLLANSKAKLVLLALPATYLELVADDLSSLTAKQRERIRVLTSKLGEASVPEHLRPYVLPYDERLEGAPEYAGTRNDFPQRALLHFVSEIEGHQRNLNSAYSAVSRKLAKLKKPDLPQRAKRSDDEISALLRKNWNKHSGQSSRLL